MVVFAGIDQTKLDNMETCKAALAHYGLTEWKVLVFVCLFVCLVGWLVVFFIGKGGTYVLLKSCKVPYKNMQPWLQIFKYWSCLFSCYSSFEENIVRL